MKQLSANPSVVYEFHSGSGRSGRRDSGSVTCSARPPPRVGEQLPSTTGAGNIARTGPRPFRPSSSLQPADRPSVTSSFGCCVRFARSQLSWFARRTATPNAGDRTRAGRCRSAYRIIRGRQFRRTAPLGDDQQATQHTVRRGPFRVVSLILPVAGGTGKNAVFIEPIGERSGIFAGRAITPSCLRAHAPDLDQSARMSTEREQRRSIFSAAASGWPRVSVQVQDVPKRYDQWRNVTETGANAQQPTVGSQKAARRQLELRACRLMTPSNPEWCRLGAHE